MIRTRSTTETSRTVLLTTMLILSVIAMSTAFAGSAAAVESSVTVPSQVEPGETVTVELEAIAQDEPISDVTTNLDEAGFEAVTVNTSAETFTESPELIILYEQQDELTVTYEVTIPEDAEAGEIFTVEGAIGDATTEAHSFGPETITVAEDSVEEPVNTTLDVETEATPGETITAELNAEAGSELIGAVQTDIDEAGFASASVAEVSADTQIETVSVIGFTEQQGSVSVTYEVTIPEDAEADDTFRIEGEVIDAAESYHEFGQTITVVDDPTSKYTDENGTVNDDGLVNAVIDWQNGDLADDDLVTVLIKWQD